MELSKMIRKGRLKSTLEYNDIKMDLDLMEDLEICLDGDMEELVKRFGNGKCDIGMIKEKANCTLVRSMEIILMEMYHNNPKYDILDQENIYDTKDGVVYE